MKKKFRFSTVYIADIKMPILKHVNIYVMIKLDVVPFRNSSDQG